MIRGGTRDYKFPFEKFSSLLHSNDPITHPPQSAVICLVTSLTLKYVHLDDQVVEHLSSNCQFLKYLCLSGSTELVNVRVISPLHKLEHLEISDVFYVKSLEISATNLSSFTYSGPPIHIPFKSLPRLLKVSIGGTCSPHFISAFRDYSRYISQLEVLTLTLDNEVDSTLINDIWSFPIPEFSNLKQLELVVFVRDGDHGILLLYTPLIKAFPLLHRLVIQLVLTDRAHKERSSPIELCKFMEFAQHPYKCLKVVELAGFVGCPTDTELALYFLKNARSLDKMIINPHNLPIRSLWKLMKPKGLQAARKRSRQLQTEVPSGVELVIL